MTLSASAEGDLDNLDAVHGELLGTSCSLTEAARHHGIGSMRSTAEEKKALLKAQQMKVRPVYTIQHCNINENY